MFVNYENCFWRRRRRRILIVRPAREPWLAGKKKKKFLFLIKKSVCILEMKPVYILEKMLPM